MCLVRATVVAYRLWLVVGQDGCGRDVNERLRFGERSRCLLHQCHHALEVYVSAHEEHRVLGSVIAPCEPECVLRGVSLQHIFAAEDIVAEGMSGKDGTLEIVVDEFGRRVVVAFNLVAYHLHLLVYLVLGICAEEDDVRQEIHGAREMLLQYGGVIHGVLLVCKGVELSAHAFEAVENLHCRTVLCSLERHVLAEMGDALFPIPLVARAGTYLISAIHHGGL